MDLTVTMQQEEEEEDDNWWSASDHLNVDRVNSHWVWLLEVQQQKQNLTQMKLRKWKFQLFF